MSNKFLNSLKENNYKLTENGGVAYDSTTNKIYDLFALGGAYRKRTDEEVIQLFANAYSENPLLALKCLFYLRDVLQGQGERRFFRVCMKWLANMHPEVVLKNLHLIPFYGRWDDLYVFIDTPLEEDSLKFLKRQFYLDYADLQKEDRGISLLGKWLKSCNASSKETRRLGKITCKAFGLTEKQYRKALSKLRNRLKVVEKLMSENRWEEIEFEKVPSKAGLIYRNAFARSDIGQKYKDFIANKNTKVNAKALYPYEVVHQVFSKGFCNDYSVSKKEGLEREVLNKYWDNLTDYFREKELNALAVVDTSGSMIGRPMEVAISLGLYCADKARGPFKNHFITFSTNPQLLEITGKDFVDKVVNIANKCIIDSTNLTKVFDLILTKAIKHNLKQEELPENIIIISDMEINVATYNPFDSATKAYTPEILTTEMEKVRAIWEKHNYKMPKLIYWNVDARNNTILDNDSNSTFVSGFSPVIFEQIIDNKKEIDIMWDKLLSKRYDAIQY